MKNKVNTNEYIIKDGYTELVINSPKYGRFVAKISNQDVEKCKKYSWCIRIQSGRCINKLFYYIECSECKPYHMLHRYIMDAPKGMVVDHINHDTLNNTRENLRVCTPRENRINSELDSANKTGKTGVFYDTALKHPKWSATVKLEDKRIYLGYFDTFEDAVKAREDAENKYYGEFICRTNN